MIVEKSGKKGPITIILNGNGEDCLFWQIFNYLNPNLITEESCRSEEIAKTLIKEKSTEYWENFDKVFNPRRDGVDEK